MLVLLLLGGCGSGATNQSSDPKSSHLNWLLQLRTHALSQGRLPKSEDEFKRYIASLDAATLDRITTASGVDSVDEFFISERDGQPYVVFYGQRPQGVPPDLIAYEQMGVDGKRFVGYGLGVVEEVDEQRFNELVPPASRPKQ